MLTKPANGGMPTSATAATVKQPNVTGIFLPSPARSGIYSRPVRQSTAPAQKNARILISAWKAMCSIAPDIPAGVISVAPNRIYDKFATVDHARRRFQCVSLTARAAP